MPLRNPLELFDRNSGAKFLMSAPKPKQREVRSGSFATGASQQQVRPCPLCPESGSNFPSISGSATGRFGLVVLYQSEFDCAPMSPRPGSRLVVGQAALEPASNEGRRKQDREVDQRHDRIDLERPIGVGVDQGCVVDE